MLLELTVLLHPKGGGAHPVCTAVSRVNLYVADQVHAPLVHVVINLYIQDLETIKAKDAVIKGLPTNQSALSFAASPTRPQAPGGVFHNNPGAVAAMFRQSVHERLR